MTSNILWSNISFANVESEKNSCFQKPINNYLNISIRYFSLSFIGFSLFLLPFKILGFHQHQLAEAY
jgi:hypothetical protein